MHAWPATAFLIVNLRNIAAAGSCCCLLMHLKVLIFRGNALIYIKGPYIFLLAYFFTIALCSPPTTTSSSFLHPQVHISRAEELHRPFPNRASPASGPAGALHQESVDQGVAELAGRRDGQALQALHATVSHPGHPCGRRLLPPTVSRQLR